MKHIGINSTNEFHLLRHFETVSENYLNTLIGREYKLYDYTLDRFSDGIITKELAYEALKTTGSKFFANIDGISNPKNLLELISNKFESMSQDIKWELNGTKKFSSFLIKNKEKVGFKNLVPLSSLKHKDQLRVKSVPRGSTGGEESIYIKTIRGINANPINTIEVGLTDFQELPYYFVTAYPGDLESTLDFPSPVQSSEEYKESKDYWDTHVFII